VVLVREFWLVFCVLLMMASSIRTALLIFCTNLFVLFLYSRLSNNIKCAKMKRTHKKCENPVNEEDHK
jgi:hypothetical protein